MERILVHFFKLIYLIQEGKLTHNRIHALYMYMYASPYQYTSNFNRQLSWRYRLFLTNDWPSCDYGEFEAGKDITIWACFTYQFISLELLCVAQGCLEKELTKLKSIFFLYGATKPCIFKSYYFKLQHVQK